MNTRLHTLAPCLAVLAYLALPSAEAQIRPGITTRADVVKYMGEPDMAFQADVLAGDVEIDPTPGDIASVNSAFRRARTDPDKRSPVLYDVMQYWDGPKTTSRTSFVFREGEDRLLYAVVKPSPSEASVEAAIKRYGREAVVEQRFHEKGHIIQSAVHLVYAKEGVELVIETRDLRVSKKLYVHRDAKGYATLP